MFKIFGVNYKTELKKLNKEYNSDTLKNTKEYRLKYIDLQKKYNIISDYDYDTVKTKVMGEDKKDIDSQIDLLKIDYKYKKIDWAEYNKKVNDLLGKPWVAIRSLEDGGDPDHVQIEVVHNKEFVNYCRNLGLPGDTDDQVAESWLKWFFITNIDDEDLASMMSNEEEGISPNTNFVSSKKVDKNIVVG